MQTKEQVRIEEIKQRLHNSTPGPWRTERNNNIGWKVTAECLANEPCDRAGCDCLTIYGVLGKEDAEFISASPEDISYLLSLLEEKNEIISKLNLRLFNSTEHADEEDWDSLQSTAFWEGIRGSGILDDKPTTGVYRRVKKKKITKGKINEKNRRNQKKT